MARFTKFAGGSDRGGVAQNLVILLLLSQSKNLNPKPPTVNPTLNPKPLNPNSTRLQDYHALPPKRKPLVKIAGTLTRNLATPLDDQDFKTIKIVYYHALPPRWARCTKFGTRFGAILIGSKFPAKCTTITTTTTTTTTLLLRLLLLG